MTHKSLKKKNSKLAHRTQAKALLRKEEGRRVKARNYKIY